MRRLTYLCQLLALVALVSLGCPAKAPARGPGAAKEGADKAEAKASAQDEGAVEAHPEGETETGGAAPGEEEEKDEYHRSMELAGRNMEAIFKALETGDFETVGELAREIAEATGSWPGFTPHRNGEQIDDYRAGCKDFQGLIERLVEAASGGDGEAISQAANGVATLCHGCHEVFKPEEEGGEGHEGHGD